MPHILINGCNYYYEIHNPEITTDTIVFSHGLLWSGKMFWKQVQHLERRYRVVIYDHRGQGQSQVTETGYDMDDLYKDALALIQALNLGPVHFAGLSMGGFIGMRLAARNPELIRSLILMETSAQPEPNKFKYSMLSLIVKLFGVQVVANKVMNIMFGKTFMNDPTRNEERAFWKNELNKNQKSITRAVAGVIHRKGMEHELKNIKCPTLIMVGTEDVATVPAKAEYMRSYITGAQLHYIKNAGHSASIEEPEQVNACLDAFLAGGGR